MSAEATLAGFRMVVCRWLMTQGEVRAILGISGADADRVQPCGGDDAAEATMLMVVEIEEALRSALGGASARSWARTPSPAHDGEPPVRAMADPVVLRAMWRVVTGRSRTQGSRRA